MAIPKGVVAEFGRPLLSLEFFYQGKPNDMTEEPKASKKEEGGTVFQKAARFYDDKPEQKQALQLLKYIGILVGIVIAIVFWWISIPSAITWYLWKKTTLDKQKKVAMAVSAFVVFFCAFAIVKSTNTPPVLAITEPKDVYSFQAASTKIKGTVDPKESTVTIDDVAVEVKDGVFEQEVQLKNEQNTFHLVAKNGAGEKAIQLDIQRQLTDAEKADKAKQEEDQKKQQEAADQKRKDELKGSVEDFYNQVLAAPKQADDTYKQWTDNLGKTTDAQAYLDAGIVKQNMDATRSAFADIKAPEGLPEDEKSRLRDGLSELSTAYFTRSNAMKNMQDYLNKQDLNALQKAKDNNAMSQSFILSGLSKILEVTMRYGVGTK